MTRKTFSVISGYQDRERRFWVMVRGHGKPLQTSEALPEGAQVRIEGAKAVRA